MSVSASIPDTSLGLTSSEIQILRQQQQIALQNSHAGNGASRGRGAGRVSNSSSRATSAASSQGRLLLDPDSLHALSHQLGSLERRISGQIDYLSQQITDSVKRSRSGALKTMHDVEAEMARTRSMMASADDLENELAKIAHIRDIVKSFRGRIEGIDRRMEQSRRRR
ncbi:hypothetical protein N7504_010288 [Penicillium tannophilum]|uniref:Biogenesis of lysosome-related organelles complex 1 subunit CNL1 n=1 Tax=Penicillium frequentans TaxID=3151616 RepID=A0AAD6D760_9EURO|nr:uncharacterized protein N7503_000370 [Penicillium pulvis]KAJ5557167.1 hypothetical protein N7494_001082 [Penicillium glabrum]KAJ5560354.1 hypothetical protein N7513_002753 [Penicillium glabrum]KAJ5813620.1 hypothetical protein N7503_000370 [Penicillium pulvis]KAJ5889478.1 hypothetical protein N7504_010288 [Penicillium tannophilum]